MYRDDTRDACPPDSFAVYSEPGETALEHAESCNTCRSAYAFIQRLRGVLSEERTAETAPEGFAEKVMVSVRENPQVGTRHIAERVHRRVGRRKNSIRETARKYAVPFMVSAAAAMFFLVGSAFWQFRVNRMYRFVYTDARARYEQRRAATASFVMVKEGKADVAGLMEDGTVYLVGQMDDDVFGETCVFVYADDQWRRLERKVSDIGDEDLARSWELIRRNSTVVRVSEGTLPIPERMWKENLSGRGEIAVLAFIDRSELWDRYTLEEYLRPPVRMDG